MTYSHQVLKRVALLIILKKLLKSSTSATIEVKMMTQINKDHFLDSACEENCLEHFK